LEFRSGSSPKKNVSAFTGQLSATFVAASEFIILWWGKEELHLVSGKVINSASAGPVGMYL
jgi:hypothetical protein